MKQSYPFSEPVSNQKSHSSRAPQHLQHWYQSWIKMNISAIKQTFPQCKGKRFNPRKFSI